MTGTSGNRTYLEYQLKDDPKPGAGLYLAVLQKHEPQPGLKYSNRYSVLLLLKHYVYSHFKA